MLFVILTRTWHLNNTTLFVFPKRVILKRENNTRLWLLNLHKGQFVCYGFVLPSIVCENWNSEPMTPFWESVYVSLQLSRQLLIMALKPDCHLVYSKLRSITHVATKVHVILRSFVLSIWMCDTIELVEHVTLWNNTKCNIWMVYCGPLHLTFPSNVAYACTNI